MRLNDAARDLIGTGADATLVTLNADGSPQVTLVWVALQSTPEGDELVTAHLAEHQKVRNVRRDPRVAVTVISPDGAGKATITIPANNFVASSRDGISGGFTTSNYAVTQEFAGAKDLDIKPADNTQLVTVGRVYATAGKPITANLYYDAASWTASWPSATDGRAATWPN